MACFFDEMISFCDCIPADTFPRGETDLSAPHLFKSGKKARNQRNDRKSALHEDDLRIACNASVSRNQYDIPHQAHDGGFAAEDKHGEQDQDGQKPVIDALILKQDIDGRAS